MLLSISRRTDIPCWYAEWFYNRLREGFVLVRNPRNPHQISRISLSPAVVDGMVFWTKNPLPMLPQLSSLDPYPYYVQFTLNPYGTEIEPGLPSKSRVLIPAFRQLSKKIGPERVLWRYDPIFLNAHYTMEYHIHYFEALARRLAPYTSLCTFSFLDLYPNMDTRAGRPCTLPEQQQLAEAFSRIAGSFALPLCTCAEAIDLSALGIRHGRCIDAERFSRLLSQPLEIEKDRNQRPCCGCAESIDIGSYHTCQSCCRYCYANGSASQAAKQFARHDPTSPLLFGTVGPEDRITERKMHSCRSDQLTLL